MKPPTRNDVDAFLYEREVDGRLQGMFARLRDREFPLDLEEVATLMRGSYGQGYMDSLREQDDGQDAVLLIENGIPIPQRRKP